MTFPMLVSGLNSLGKAFGLNTTLAQALNRTIEAKVALSQAEIKGIKARDVEAAKEQVLQNILNREHEKGNLLKVTTIEELSDEAKARALATAATGREAAAIKGAEAAQRS